MKNSALILIDVQNGMFEVDNPVYKGAEVLQNLQILVGNARQSSVPIFFLQHCAAKGKLLEPYSYAWEISREMERKEEDITITKKTPDAFYGTHLKTELKKREIHHLVLAGIQTELCVDTTCRVAHHYGYKVTIVSDGHSTWSNNSLSAEAIIHHHNQIFHWFADVYPTKDISFID